MEVFVKNIFVKLYKPPGEISSMVGLWNFSKMLLPSLAEILLVLLSPSSGLALSILDVRTVVLNGALVQEL
jgi:hypothetical protein